MPTPLLHKIYDPEEFRKQGHQLIDLLTRYLQDSQAGSGKVYPGIRPSGMLEIWKSLPVEGLTPNEIFEKTIENSIHLHHPRYIGHQVVPPAPITALADMMAALLNNGMAVYEMGPASTAMERIVIGELCRWMDLPDTAGGFLTSGGSLGNLTALLSARKQMHVSSDISHAGIMVSEQAHYSIERAAVIMGLPIENIIKIPVDHKLGINPKHLEECYLQARERGIKPFVMVGSACTTSTGSYDPLPELAAFAQKEGLWFHIDAAHGGIARMLPDYQHLVDGLEQADSIVIDFHKMFMVPALTTAVLFRNESKSFGSFSQEAEYLLQASEIEEWYNSGNRTIECTKLMMGFKVFTLMQLYGKEAFIDYGNTTFGLARVFAGLLSQDPRFELAIDPQSNILCFRMEGLTNEGHTKLREALLKKGDFYIVQTKIADSTFFRITVMNPFTTVEDFKQLLEHLVLLRAAL